MSLMGPNLINDFDTVCIGLGSQRMGNNLNTYAHVPLFCEGELNKENTGSPFMLCNLAGKIWGYFLTWPFCINVV